MRWSRILSWPSAILFGLILTVAPSSATPAQPGSPNIPSSILLDVADLVRERVEAVKPELPSGERSKKAVDAIKRDFGKEDNPLRKRPDDDQAHPPAPAPASAGPVPRTRKLAPRPELRQLKGKYDKDTSTHDDTLKYPLPKEADPPLEVHKQRTVDDTEKNHEKGKEQGKQEKRCTATTLSGHTQEGYCYHDDDGILRFRPE